MKRTAVGVLGHGDDAHGLLGNVSAQHFHISAEFIRSEDSSAHPVCPEDVLAVHGQAEGVHGLVLQDHLYTHSHDTHCEYTSTKVPMSFDCFSYFHA